MGRTFCAGDRVAYGAAWLRATGQTTGWAPRARGVVTHVEPFGPKRALVTVQWDGTDKTIGVLDANLTLVARIGIDSALAT
jgi:hypothetical protein